jgi:DNA-binding response OmpR family regulator
MPREALVVDDEPATCELIREVLLSVGLDSQVVTRSAECAGHFSKRKFDVILLDFRMAPPDGPELARQIRSSGLNQMTPIIMISDDQRTSAVVQGFEAGANFFLYKPIDRTRLLKLVRTTQGSIEHERRRFRRIELRSKVQLRSESEAVEGETVDVSLGGALVRAPRLFPAPSSVQVSLYLVPDAKPVVGHASVMRTIGSDRMGIRFDHLSVSESARLQEFLLPLIPAA